MNTDLLIFILFVSVILTNLVIFSLTKWITSSSFLNRLQEAHELLARFMAQAPDRNLCRLHPHQGGCAYCDAVRHFGKDPNQ